MERVQDASHTIYATNGRLRTRGGIVLGANSHDAGHDGRDPGFKFEDIHTAFTVKELSIRRFHTLLPLYDERTQSATSPFDP